VLFQLSAERAHELAAFALRQPAPWRLIGSTPRDPRLETQVGGLHLPNPVGLAAGFDKNLRFLDALGALGSGYVVGGTVTALPGAPPRPLFVKLPPYPMGTGREAVLRLVRIAEEEGVDGVTASNTFPIESPEMSIGTGGLSGRAVFPDTLRIVRDIYQVTEGR